MPAYLTHRAAGERVLEKLKKDAIGNVPAFYLGCQGPDILYFRNYVPWRSGQDSFWLGVAMHSEKTRELLRNALDFTRRYHDGGREELVSYIAGFIAHYAIDKNAHPFVYKETKNDSHVHHKLEFMWDSFTAKEQWGIEPEQYDIYSEVMYGQIGQGICDWYQAAAKDVYGKIISADVIREAQKHFAKAKRMLANIGFPGKLLIRMINAISGFDAGTMTYPEKRDFSLFSKKTYASMQDMITKGVDEACAMISFGLDYIKGVGSQELPAWFGDADFAGELYN